MSSRNLKAIAGVTAVVFISKLLGVGREMTIAYRFGTSPEYDLYLVAVMFPALAWGVINFASFYLLVPYLTRTLSGQSSRGDSAGWREVWSLFNVAVLTTVGIFAAIFISAPYVLRIWAGSELSSHFDELVFYARVSGVVVVLGTIEAFFRAILNVRRVFAYPSGGPIVDNLVNIIAVMVLSQFFSVGALVIGLIGGMLFQDIYLAIRLVPLGVYKGYRMTVKGSHAAMLLPTAGILILIEAINRSYFLIDRYVGPGFGSGVISALNYGQILVQLPDAIVGFAISAVVFPIFSAVQTDDDEQGFLHTYREAVVGGLLVSVPLAVYFFVNASDIIQLVFLRGVFNATSLELTSHILGPYAPTIVALTVISISVRAGYGRGWTRWVLGFTILSLVIKVCGTLLLPRYVGYPGISGATSISQVLLAGQLLWLCTSKAPSDERSGVLRRIGTVLLSGVVTLLVLWLCSSAIQGYIPGHTLLDAVVRLSISAVILVAAHLLLMYILGMGSYVSRIARVHK